MPFAAPVMPFGHTTEAASLSQDVVNAGSVPELAQPEPDVTGRATAEAARASTAAAASMMRCKRAGDERASRSNSREESRRAN